MIFSVAPVVLILGSVTGYFTTSPPFSRRGPSPSTFTSRPPPPSILASPRLGTNLREGQSGYSNEGGYGESINLQQVEDLLIERNLYRDERNFEDAGE